MKQHICKINCKSWEAVQWGGRSLFLGCFGQGEEDNYSRGWNWECWDFLSDIVFELAFLQFSRSLQSSSMKSRDVFLNLVFLIISVEISKTIPPTSLRYMDMELEGLIIPSLRDPVESE